MRRQRYLALGTLVFIVLITASCPWSGNYELVVSGDLYNENGNQTASETPLNNLAAVVAPGGVVSYYSAERSANAVDITGAEVTLSYYLSFGLQESPIVITLSDDGAKAVRFSDNVVAVADGASVAKAASQALKAAGVEVAAAGYDEDQIIDDLLFLVPIGRGYSDPGGATAEPELLYQEDEVTLKVPMGPIVQSVVVRASVSLAAGGGTKTHVFTVLRQLPELDDTDGDGLPDAWEEMNSLDPNDSSGPNGALGDPDGDGLINILECVFRTMPYGPDGGDTDGDGISDGWEVSNGLLPRDSRDAGQDFDDDQLTNVEEFQLGTDPNRADTDGDSYPDGIEVEAGTDPLDSNSYPGQPSEGEGEGEGESEIQAGVMDIKVVHDQLGNPALSVDHFFPRQKTGELAALDQVVDSLPTGVGFSEVWYGLEALSETKVIYQVYPTDMPEQSSGVSVIFTGEGADENNEPAVMDLTEAPFVLTPFVVLKESLPESKDEADSKVLPRIYYFRDEYIIAYLELNPLSANGDGGWPIDLTGAEGEGEGEGEGEPLHFIVQPPPNLEANTGQRVAITVAAAGGTPPYHFQAQKFVGSDWQNLVNAPDLTGVNEPTLVFSAITPTQAGIYRFVVVDSESAKAATKPAKMNRGPIAKKSLTKVR